jgi:hypothetical protein
VAAGCRTVVWFCAASLHPARPSKPMEPNRSAFAIALQFFVAFAICFNRCLPRRLNLESLDITQTTQIQGRFSFLRPVCAGLSVLIANANITNHLRAGSIAVRYQLLALSRHAVPRCRPVALNRRFRPAAPKRQLQAYITGRLAVPYLFSVVGACAAIAIFNQRPMHYHLRGSNRKDIANLPRVSP